MGGVAQRLMGGVRSLRARLVLLWLLSLAAAVVVAALILALDRASTAARTAEAEVTLARAAERLAGAYDFYTAGLARAPEDAHFMHGLGTVVRAALAGVEGVEGGIWQEQRGSLAYAFPTYEGSGVKSDLPAAESATIAAINAEARQERAPVARRERGKRQTLLLYARPLTAAAAIPGASVWVMTRVEANPAVSRLQAALAALLVLVLLLSLWLWRLARGWGRHIGAIEAALRAHDLADLPALPATGERDLDRILAALNEASDRLAQARREAETLTRKAAEAERLAALGRVAAGIAHEIRNPLAAMRLKAENALAAAPAPETARARQALAAILVQIARLDHLVGEILSLTQRPTPRPEPVDVSRLLAALVAEHGDLAARAGVRLSHQGPALTAVFDPALTRRALAALIDNALRHTPPGGKVSLRADREGGTLVIRIADTGPGIAEDLRARLFEPFVTGRPDGTGLGLAIAREMAAAQAGSLHLLDPGGYIDVGETRSGAVFALVLAWQDPGSWPSS
jgi:signal transduction histidine kinase